MSLTAADLHRSFGEREKKKKGARWLWRPADRQQMIADLRLSDWDVKTADVNKKQMATGKTFGSDMSNNWAETA